MKVSELLELLKGEDPNRLVVLKREDDPDFVPVGRVTREAYAKEINPDMGTTGAIYEDGTAEVEEDRIDFEDGALDEEEIRHPVPALVLWPEDDEDA